MVTCPCRFPRPPNPNRKKQCDRAATMHACMHPSKKGSFSCVESLWDPGAFLGLVHPWLEVIKTKKKYLGRKMPERKMPEQGLASPHTSQSYLHNLLVHKLPNVSLTDLVIARTNTGHPISLPPPPKLPPPLPLPRRLHHCVAMHLPRWVAAPQFPSSSYARPFSGRGTSSSLQTAGGRPQTPAPDPAPARMTEQQNQCQLFL